MATIVAKLAPILVSVAFTLQGCLFADFKPAVRIAIGEQCHQKVSKISDDEGIKDVHAAKACNDLDQGKLTKFKVTDCKTVLHDVVHFFLGVTCEAMVADSAKGSCKPFSGADCKKDVDAAVQSFDPAMLDQMAESAEGDAMEDGFEAVLGLVKACGGAVSTAVDSDSSKKIITDMCAETDDNAMSTMGVDKNHCKDYLIENMVELGVVACIMQTTQRDDAPASPDAVTFEWMDKASKEFGEKLGAHFDETCEEVLSESGSARLRLFQAMRQGKWPVKVQRWSPVTIMAAWVAGALALAALLGVAWRRRSIGQPVSQDADTILLDE